MSVPEEQVKFLVNLQRLLAEGQFVSTYKYALLLALADLSVEHGNDTDDILEISTRSVAEKFIQYYWRQTLPYVPTGNPEQAASVLKQNTGIQAGVLKALEPARRIHGGLATLKFKHHGEWKQLVNKVDQIVRVMPVWKLQTVGSERLSFLYDNVDRGNRIVLQPGVAFCFRKFYWIIGDMVRGAWVRYVRRFNPTLLGTTTDLQEFLFGSERESLKLFVPILNEIQKDVCFYCGGRMKGDVVHVDHFIPWSRYPVDLGHNFVLAHARPCNAKKSDRIASMEHLDAWVRRNDAHGNTLVDEFDRHQIVHDLPTSVQVARWAYSQVESSAGLTWRGGEELVKLDPGWKTLLVS